MEKLSNLYESLQNSGVLIFERKIPFTDALIIETDGLYGLFIDRSQYESSSEELVSVAHESGHIFTASLHSLENRHNLVEQDECRANRWAIKKLLPYDELIKAMQSGYTTRYALAEYFNVTEKFIDMAYHYYSIARGLSFR